MAPGAATGQSTGMIWKEGMGKRHFSFWELSTVISSPRMDVSEMASRYGAARTSLSVGL